MGVATLAREAAANVPRTVPGLQLWLDARRPGATFADGNAVGTWKDLSGFGRDVAQATAAKKPVYRTPTTTGYLSLPGVAGNYASTPDSAALSITGDIDLQARIMPTSWTVGAVAAIVDKEPLTTGRSYRLDLGISKKLSFIHATAAVPATSITALSTTTIPFSDGQAGWVRVTMDVDNGAGGNDVAFYTAADQAGVPSSWTQLGTTVTVAGTTDIYDGTGPLEIGSRDVGTASPFAGQVYRARVLNGIGGTVVFDADFTTAGRSFTESSSNHAVVTVNGTGARESVPAAYPTILFDGVDDFLAAALTQAQPLTVYVVARPDITGAARTWVGGVANNWTGVSASAYEAYGGTALTTGTPAVAAHVVSAVYNDTSSVLSVDGTATTGAAGTNGLTALNVGALNGTSQFTQGAIAAVLVYAGAHDANTRKRMERWLGRQYGITVA